MVNRIGSQRTARRQPDSIRLVRMVRTIDGQTCRIHHPDEPDGVRTRDAAAMASTGDCPGDRLSKSSLRDLAALSPVARNHPTYPPKSAKAELHPREGVRNLACASG
ncbi:MAG: hypothetical protein ACLQNE_03405 [Thermoguttaceae bacterium]|jgi:hypothetical protein